MRWFTNRSNPCSPREHNHGPKHFTCVHVVERFLDVVEADALADELLKR